MEKFEYELFLTKAYALISYYDLRTMVSEEERA